MNEPVVVGNVTAVLPLTLLESVRAHDRPEEFLENEDLMLSMPRRLGLTGVVDNQIRQYQAAESAGRAVSLEEVASLIKLVLKRDDAAMILRETGRRMAEQHFQRLPEGYIRILRVLPSGLLLGSWRRSARSLLRQMVGTVAIEVGSRPAAAARLRPNPLAMLEPTGTACALYASVLERLAELYTDASPYAVETRCCATGEDCCEWTISGL